MRLSAYNTPLSGMLAAQLGLQTTQQNLSNVHTPGYVRQTVKYGAVGGGGGNTHTEQIGYGVKTVSVDRITDELKANEYNDQLSQFARYSYMSTFLTQVESSVGMPGEGSLSSLMNDFLNGFHEVAKNPGQVNSYQGLIADAKEFMNHVNRVSKSFDSFKIAAEKDATDYIGEFNRLANDLAETNKKISEAGPLVPNQLLDERDAIISEMSQYANIEVSYESTNPNIANIRINGVLTVSGQDTHAINWNASKTGIQISGQDIPLQGGSILAAIEAKEKVAAYNKELQDFIGSFAGEVNGIIGKDFFMKGPEGIYVNPDVEKNPLDLQITSDKAKELAELGNKPYKNGISYQQSLDRFLVQVATDTKEANVATEIHGDLLEGISQEKQGIEGVNIDEEMINLMTYQRYFAANSKAINTLNEVFDSLFSIIQ